MQHNKSHHLKSDPGAESFGNSNRYDFFASNLCHICGISSFFAVTALCVRLMSRGCFGFCALAAVRGLCVVCATCLAPPPNLAVKRDAALKRVAPYF